MRLISIALTTLVLGACSGAEDGVIGQDLGGGGDYVLPWKVGFAHAVGQGDGGVLPDGSHSDHTEHLCNGAGQCGQLMIHAIDFEMSFGEEVTATNEGAVVFVSDSTRPGDACFNGDGNTGKCAGHENLVVVRHPDGLESQYLHFSTVLVTKGQHVSRGEVIGLVGATGQASGPHLHFQVQKPCGSAMCQSLKLSFKDVGLPAPGTFPIRSADGVERCWSEALHRYVNDACVQDPNDSSTWRQCSAGEWQTLSAGAACNTSSVYGYCQTETGDWIPERSCHAFPRGNGNYDWKQCGKDASWLAGVVEYSNSGPLGGLIGRCAGVK